MKKLLLASLVSTLLVGCGGSDDNSGNTTVPPAPLPPPAVEGGELPDISVDYEDPSTTPCEEGMECMDEGFTNPNLPSVAYHISKLLNWDTEEIEDLCNIEGVECNAPDDIPTFTVYEDFKTTIYRPTQLENSIEGVQVLFPSLTNSTFSLFHDYEANCALINIEDGKVTVTYNKTPSLGYLELAVNNFSGSFDPVCWIDEVSIHGNSTPHWVAPLNPSYKTFPDYNKTLQRIMFEKALVSYEKI